MATFKIEERHGEDLFTLTFDDVAMQLIGIAADVTKKRGYILEMMNGDVIEKPVPIEPGKQDVVLPAQERKSYEMVQSPSHPKQVVNLQYRIRGT